METNGLEILERRKHVSEIVKEDAQNKACFIEFPSELKVEFRNHTPTEFRNHTLSLVQSKIRGMKIYVWVFHRFIKDIDNKSTGHNSLNTYPRIA